MQISHTSAVIIHAAAGVVSGLSALVHPVLPIPACWIFVRYECKQSKEIGDTAHTAIRHFAVAFFITLGVIVVLKLCGIGKW